MSSYAAQTNVTEDRTKHEIERTLLKFGAKRFGSFTDIEAGVAVVQFCLHNLNVQMKIPLPDPREKRFLLTPARGSKRDEGTAALLWQQEVRSRWRALSLAIKAKLVAVEEGITTFETEFMPYMVTPDGRTLGERMLPMIEAAKANGGMLMLTGPGGDA